MSPNLQSLSIAAEHLANMLPLASRDLVSMSTLRRHSDEMVLLVVLPRNLAHLQLRLPESIDGVHVVYEVGDPPTLN